MTDEDSPDQVDVGPAYMLLRAMFLRHVDTEILAPALVAELIDATPEPEELLRGLCAVINELVGFVDEAYRIAAEEGVDLEAGDSPQDMLHVFTPALVAKLAHTPGIDQPDVAIVAGGLTAAALGYNCYDWRRRLGEWPDVERVVWAYAAWYLCDLIDHVNGKPGFAVGMIGSSLDEPLI